MNEQIRRFDSLEDMQTWMRVNEDLANRVLATEFQKQIQPGDYVARPHDMGGIPLLIVAKTMTLVEFLKGEAEAGAKGHELVEEEQQMLSVFERGYRYARWYSVLVPEGEYGDAHISSLYPITQQLFEQLMEHIRDGIDPYSLWYVHKLNDNY